jgi:hypothetical protein
MDDDRQLLELTSQEEWERRNSVDLLKKLERDVRRSSALRRVLDAERRAANPDEHELEHEHEC